VKLISFLHTAISLAQMRLDSKSISKVARRPGVCDKRDKNVRILAQRALNYDRTLELWV
jgi:hypothetical protein